MNEVNNPQASSQTPKREGSLEAPTRHELDWRSEQFYDENELNKELERVFDICHGCRRCFNLCHAFPTLFDLVDESSTMEVDGVDKQDYKQVVEHCYLCDMCFMTKCPYVPPHEWAVDFPHLMLRAKAVNFRKNGASLRDKVLSSTDAVGSLAGIPVVSNIANASNKSSIARKAMEATIGVHAGAKLPEFEAGSLRSKLAKRDSQIENIKSCARTKGKVALFLTCYGNRNEHRLGNDLVAVFEHNQIEVIAVKDEKCCGMPKFELGDLDAVAKAKDNNVPKMLALIEQGYDIVAPIPSCALMFRQELPLMFADDADVQKVSQHIFDPFEYLSLRHKSGLLNTSFSNKLGTVAYHAACHQRVQNVGPRTAEIFSLVPDTKVITIERCSGHDGTYAVKKEFHDIAMKIVKPVSRQVNAANPDYYTSDCVMAGNHIQNGLQKNFSDNSNGTNVGDKEAIPPLSLLRYAYGI